MIVSFGTCDLKLYTVIIIFIRLLISLVCFSLILFCYGMYLTVFKNGKDIVNVSVKGNMRKEETEGMLHRERESERGTELTLLQFR